MLGLVLSLASLTATLPPVFDPLELRNGQRGQCLTVFEGDEIEPFEFVVKDRMKNFLGPGRDLVLVKLIGKKVEFTGVVAGMSGSPCSINGKLLGALSYAFASFAKEPIAGITPIGDMLDTLEMPAAPLPWRQPGDSGQALSASKTSAPLVAQLLPNLSHQVDTAEQVSHYSSIVGEQPLPIESDGSRRQPPSRTGAIADSVFAGGGNLRLSPIATPLSVAGLSPELQRVFSPFVERAGFFPVAAGGATTAAGDGGAQAETRRSLAPGDAVAAVLVRGDVDIAATGTVTTVEDGKVTAFGHPFMGSGAVSIPMARAKIVNTMVSQIRSFKMSASQEVVGELTQDRLPAIAGYLGRNAAMIPVTGNVTTTAGTGSAFAFDVARDLKMSPLFLTMGLAGALSGRIDIGQRGLIRMQATLNVQTGDAKTGLGETIVIPLSGAASAQRDGSLAARAAIQIGQAVGAIWDTPFGPPPRLSVDMQVDYSPEPLTETIEAVMLDRRRARPGDMLEVLVRLRQVDGPTSDERFLIAVPKSWAGQSVEIAAPGWRWGDRVAEGLGGLPRPTDVKDIAAWLSSRRQPGNLYLIAVREGVGLRSRVDIMPFLPPSAVALFGDRLSKQPRRRGLSWEERRKRPGVITGIASASLSVTER